MAIRKHVPPLSWFYEYGKEGKTRREGRGGVKQEYCQCAAVMKPHGRGLCLFCPTVPQKMRKEGSGEVYLK